ncbi:VanZ family protein [Aquibium microcysteis]|uniref:VanZ family protein n=1 Tax=Aquibium microcysteis TaxID=675281 RepID=UPI00165D2178|nr:VanZ family protein [Aquibium microcysteis]
MTRPGVPPAPVRLRIAAGMALAVELGCIVWLASRGGDSQMRIQSLLMLDEKAAHALAFALAGLTASLASHSALWTAAGLGVVAAGIEILQSFVPDRTASVPDLLASAGGIAAGVAVGAVLWPVLLRGLRRR